MNKPAIVAIAYNRPKSLYRLLTSIGNAYYKENDITLVISIDNSGNKEVAKVAEDFEWKYGEKIVIEREVRMGLKAHVLACSSLAVDYGSVIILEDDLYVSESFYEYSCKALDFTEGDDRIGGVSLYNHLFNVHARKSFAAIEDGYDNWYFQFASSWGQAYTKSQWEGFMSWYEVHKDEPLQSVMIPANVRSWSEKSWLKYYIAYLIDTDRFFLYPRVSFTTNFGDVGSHAVKADADLQVPMMGRVDALYCTFSTVEKSRAVYDAFFENTALSGDAGEVLVDLYKSKETEKIISENKNYKYVLSCSKLPYKTVKTYGRQMRPVDANIIYEVEGDDFYLYDLSVPAKESGNASDASEYLYEYRGISAKQMLSILKYRVEEKIRK